MQTETVEIIKVPVAEYKQRIQIRAIERHGLVLCSVTGKQANTLHGTSTGHLFEGTLEQHAVGHCLWLGLTPQRNNTMSNTKAKEEKLRQAIDSLHGMLVENNVGALIAQKADEWAANKSEPPSTVEADDLLQRIVPLLNGHKRDDILKALVGCFMHLAESYALEQGRDLYADQQAAMLVGFSAIHTLESVEEFDGLYPWLLGVLMAFVVGWEGLKQMAETQQSEIPSVA